MSASALLSRSASQCTTSSTTKAHKNRKARVAFASSRASTVQVRASQHAEPAEAPAVARRSVLASGAILSAAAAASSLAVPQQAQANLVLSSDWEKVELPVDPKVVLLDIGFTESDPNHGFLLGTKQTLLETFNGGKTWEPRTIQTSQDEGFNYRFSSISFSGDEGWIVGKPAILLHTSDGGKNWKRIPLSSKLPGSPLLIHALPGAAGQAEMTTDQGAIYVTDNTAYTWSAAVQETVDATLNRTVSSGISGASFYEGYFANVARNNNGEYVAVSSRGNFYMTWAPGQAYWMPHNRPAARRIQNMGWTSDNQMWLTTRGGDLLVSPESGVTEKFEQAKVSSRGFGLLDVGFKNSALGFAVGGSGTLYKTEDGGKSWKRDKSTEAVPGNLYEVKFFGGGNGFVLGNDGILLRYIGTA